MESTTPITGYRELTNYEVLTINQIKALSSQVGHLVEQLRSKGAILDQRWVSIGQTELQQGFMALTRSVAQPTTF